MRYTVTVTGQFDTTQGPDAIRRDAGWSLEQNVRGIVPGTVQVTSVEPVAMPVERETFVLTSGDAIGSAIADLTEVELDALAEMIARVKAAQTSGRP